MIEEILDEATEWPVRMRFDREENGNIKISTPNYKFQVGAYIRWNDFVLISAYYEAGNKFVIIKGEIPEDVLDPHFTNEQVIARFAPTQQGWELAKKALKCLQ